MRCFDPVKALDHDLTPTGILVPPGILEVKQKQLNIVYGHSLETSDFIVDGLEHWWRYRKRNYSHINSLQIDLDNRLFDRRCTMGTALEKLRRLRERVKRFKNLSQTLRKLDSPTLSKSLEFLNDKRLPSTSNAVERGNRRYRKMQKTVYRVRKQSHIENRIALDMYREARLPKRRRTLGRLHWERCLELKRPCRTTARAG